MTIQVNGQEVHLLGTVGADWFDDGFTHAQLVAALARMDGDITVRLNSGGGIAAEGAAIHAALVSYEGDVAIVVEGIAASAASLIAMAGDTITMADGAVLMIHDPLNITIGNSADHAKTIEELEAYAVAYARIYASRSGKTPAEAREIMKAETWYDGEAAVAAGFADHAGKKTATKSSAKAAAFDYRAYSNAPRRLAALSKANGWSMAEQLSTHQTKSASAAPTHEDIDLMPNENLAAEVATLKADKAKLEADLAATATAADDAVKNDRARRAAILALPEAKNREALAEKLYLSKMTVDEIKDVLAAAPAGAESPTATAPAATTPLAPAVATAPDPAAEYEANRLAGAHLAPAHTASAKATNYGWGNVMAKLNNGTK